VDPARRAWTRIETVHAVTYFAPESRDAASAAGLRGFWMGYFGFRAAPLGPVGSDVVTDACWNFSPRMVERAIPDAWTFAAPADLVDVRAASAAAALARVGETGAGPDGADLERFDALVHSTVADDGAFPLFAANASLGPPASPIARLWQACTTAR